MVKIGDKATIPLFGGRSIEVTYRGGGIWKSEPVGRPGQRRRRQSWEHSPDEGWVRIS